MRGRGVGRRMHLGAVPGAARARWAVAVLPPVVLLGLAAPAVGATLAGSWRALPPAPFPSHERGLVPLTSQWSGSSMVIFRSGKPDRAAAYATSTNTWRKLNPLRARTGYLQIPTRSVWTGAQMVMMGGSNVAYTPRTNRWRQVPAVESGVLVWTGREVVGWGGGCCGDASSTGSAYNPATGTRRRLAPSPLSGRQRPPGAWTGRELIIAGGADPNEHPYKGGAAYNPRTNTWRRIAPLPTPYAGTITAWTGREVLVVGGSLTGAGFAFNPTTNRWRALPPMAHGKWNAYGIINSAAVWTGKRLIIWGGQTESYPSGPGAQAVAPRGIAYDPATNRWPTLPASPLKGYLGVVTGVWTGHQMIVWTQSGAGAAFRPRTP